MDLTSHPSYCKIWANPRLAKEWIEANPASEGSLYLIENAGNNFARIVVYDISIAGQMRFLGCIATNNPKALMRDAGQLH